MVKIKIYSELKRFLSIKYILCKIATKNCQEILKKEKKKLNPKILVKTYFFESHIIRKIWKKNCKNYSKPSIKK